MKTYIVTWREVLVTTYEVEAKDEEDAMDAVRLGEGVEIEQDTEAMPEGEDSMEAVEKAGEGGRADG